MVAIAKQNRSRKSVPAWHAGFLAMLPAIATYARLAFRHHNPEARQEAVEECLANALVAYVRLVQLGKADIAYATPLARYAVAQVRDHRKVGGHLNIGDVMSSYCQRQKKITMERLDHFDREENAWQEALVVDSRTAPVPDIVAFRCDFADWLASLPHRNRKIALKLATNESTGRVARMFKVSAGRISQLRKEFKLAWDQFTGESQPPQAAVPA